MLWSRQRLASAAFSVIRRHLAVHAKVFAHALAILVQLGTVGAATSGALTTASFIGATATSDYRRVSFTMTHRLNRLSASTNPLV